MIVQISTNDKVIGGIEIYENNENGEIFIQNKTESLSVNESKGNSEPINNILNSNDNVLDIDISDDVYCFTKAEFRAFILSKSNWVEFETERRDFKLECLDDYNSSINIVAPLKIYDIINEKEYKEIKNKIKEFFEIDEEYRYDQLDYFLTTLHPLLDICIHY